MSFCDFPINILLVEDDEVDIESVRRAFKNIKININLDIAVNGLDALNKLYGREGEEKIDPVPQLIILDIKLPKMSGLELLEKLRADPQFDQTRVIVLTTSNDEKDRMTAFNLKIAKYLLKPIQSDILLYYCKMLLADVPLHSKKMTLLIIDDEVVDRAYYQRMLRESFAVPYEALEAANAEEALSLLKANPIDCILLDYKLPDMDGINLLKSIRKQNAKQIPIIMLTGKGDNQVAARAKIEGITDYFIKNEIDPKKLTAVILQSIAKAEFK